MHSALIISLGQPAARAETSKAREEYSVYRNQFSEVAFTNMQYALVVVRRAQVVGSLVCTISCLLLVLIHRFATGVFCLFLSSFL